MKKYIIFLLFCVISSCFTLSEVIGMAPKKKAAEPVLSTGNIGEIVTGAFTEFTKCEPQLAELKGVQRDNMCRAIKEVGGGAFGAKTFRNLRKGSIEGKLRMLKSLSEQKMVPGFPKTWPKSGEFGKGTFNIISADVSSLMQNSAFNGAVFQVASQFDCLEGVSYVQTGNIAGYQRDNTQGPRCVLSTLPALVLRRYCLDPINLLLAITGKPVVTFPNAPITNIAEHYGKVVNGYLVLPDESKLGEFLINLKKKKMRFALDIIMV
jgi:hypothetical protein